MKSVVVEIRGNFAAALSDDGCITKVRNHNYAIGQVIELKKERAMPKKLAVWAASAAAVLMLCGMSGYAYLSPYSYVSLDVNPSIEFTLNRFDRVLSAKGTNDDGDVILMNVDLADLSNKSIGDAISLTVGEISKLGYFSGDEPGGIIISTSADNPNKAKKLAEELEKTVQDELIQDHETDEDAENTSEPTSQPSAGDSESTKVNPKATPSLQPPDVPVPGTENGNSHNNNLDSDDGDSETSDKHPIVIEVISVSKERVAQAKELGVTPGRLHLVEKLQETAADLEEIDVAEWLNKSVKEIQKATKEFRKTQKELEKSNDKGAKDPSDKDSADDDKASDAPNTSPKPSIDPNTKTPNPTSGSKPGQAVDRDDDDRDDNHDDDNDSKGKDKDKDKATDKDPENDKSKGKENGKDKEKQKEKGKDDLSDNDRSDNDLNDNDRSDNDKSKIKSNNGKDAKDSSESKQRFNLSDLFKKWFGDRSGSSNGNGNSNANSKSNTSNHSKANK